MLERHLTKIEYRLGEISSSLDSIANSLQGRLICEIENRTAFEGMPQPLRVEGLVTTKRHSNIAIKPPVIRANWSTEEKAKTDVDVEERLG